MAEEDGKGNYKVSADSINGPKGVANFMLEGGIYTEVDKKGKKEYIGAMDRTGPSLFFPPHCQKIDKYGIYESPIVAYVKSKSTI